MNIDEQVERLALPLCDTAMMPGGWGVGERDACVHDLVSRRPSVTLLRAYTFRITHTFIGKNYVL